MQTALDLFQDNIKRVRRLTDAYHLLIQHDSETDFSDVLRAQYVLTISALDMFIHNIIKIGMMETLRGQRKQTKEYQNFQITMNLVNFDNTYTWFESEINRRLSKETYQNPYQIFEGIKYIFNDKSKSAKESQFWELIANKLKQKRIDIINRLNEITERRNKIVHEADVKPIPTMPGELWEIDDLSVNDMIDFIESIVMSIYELLLNEKETY